MIPKSGNRFSEKIMLKQKALLPPTGLARNDHRAAHAIFLCEPGAAVALRIRPERALARIDRDVRPALRGKFLALFVRSRGGDLHGAEREGRDKRELTDLAHQALPYR